MSGPCYFEVQPVQIIIAVFSGIGGLVSIWLAHRRKLADRERHEFEDAVRNHLGLYMEVSKRDEARKNRGNGS